VGYEKGSNGWPAAYIATGQPQNRFKKIEETRFYKRYFPAKAPPLFRDDNPPLL
jgi:hypothetical protein